MLLYESAASLSTLSSSSAHKSPALTIHYLPGSMLLFLLSFFLFSPFLYLYENKALLMTAGSQGPAGARVLESVCAVERGAPPPSLPPLLSQVRIEGQEGLMCCCCTEVWAIAMAASMSNTTVRFLPPNREACL